jgi:hypothetical protein
MIAARIRRHCEHENIARGLSRSYWGQTVWRSRSSLRLSENKGTGLQIMKYWADTIGASLEIGRAGKRGVCVSCSFSKQRGRKGP